MAWLEQHPTSGRFKICFRWGDQKLKKTGKTTSRKDAEAILLRFEENMALVERGRLELPPDADVGTFLLSDGKLSGKPKPTEREQPATFVQLRDQYLSANSQGAMEENSLDTVRMHLRHFGRSVGDNFVLQTLTLENLQQHVERRSKKKYRERPLSPVTLRKEMASLRAMWNWCVQAGKLQGAFPNRGLKYPKTGEKPPFQTWGEIEKQIGRGGLSKREERDLWDGLYLSLTEIADLLKHVQQKARQPFIYPMFCLAAHTGSRKSELLRAGIGDVDLDAGSILIHEKKRARSQRTTRRVPLSEFLVVVLKEWLSIHPGGQHLFCQSVKVLRSKKSRTEPTPITKNEAHDHFHRTLEGSKWQLLRGWHVLRHSFVSNCASRGVDQRMIDEWVGHTTEEMRKRYRHLFPDQQRAAIRSVFRQG